MLLEVRQNTRFIYEIDKKGEILDIPYEKTIWLKEVFREFEKAQDYLKWQAQRSSLNEEAVLLTN